MRFLKSRQGAAVVLAVVVIGSTIFGAHRSLTAVAADVRARGSHVQQDLQSRAGVGANLYTVAGRYLDSSDADLNALSSALTALSGNVTDQSAQDALLTTLNPVMEKLGKAEDLSEKDRGYLSGFQTQLDSIAFTISHDPYTAAAVEFNNKTLSTFPASLLKTVAGVNELPVYR
ncbi:MAG: hypothetical protein VB096_09795 [Pseudoflavonifractor sp.]|nr:hypothetical protein [Pseudoflavonifractor sp.]